jgi:uncharacterized protein
MCSCFVKLSMKIKVKLQPRSSINEIIGVVDDQLQIKVTAPPENNKANKACIELLSRFFRKPKSNIILVMGTKSRTKIFDIYGLDEANLKEKLLDLKK